MDWGMEWPDKKYPVILSDPPWNFKVYSQKGMGRSAERHYPTMTRSDIRDLPVSELAADPCILFMWTTPQDMDFAIEEVMPSWGFTYKTTGFIWCKLKRNFLSILVDAFMNWRLQIPFDPVALVQSLFAMTKGYYTRKQTEPCLIATTEAIPERLDRGVPEIIVAPRREPHRKPDEQYRRIESMYDGPYLEMFARQQWSEDWDTWGLETNKFEE